MSENRGKRSAFNPENLVGYTLHNGKYTIQRVLGHGGMGKVYLATHGLQTQLAIKQARADQPLPASVITELESILHTNDLSYHASANKSGENDFPTSGGQHTDRFLREALLLARLEHFAIPTLYDYFAEDGYWYLVMDYVPGPTLSAYIHKHAPLPPLEALNYAMQICDVLDYLHHQVPPVIFRDLKPSNIILTPGGTLMLIDFGIARYFKTGQVNDTTDFGSPGYASPEQYLGEGQTDARSDIYSLGVVLHEMLSGKRPKGSSTTFESPRQVNPALSAATCGLVALTTQENPLDRLQSARIFYMALERVYAIEENLAYQHTIDQLHAQEQLSASSPGVQEESHQAIDTNKKQDSEQSLITSSTNPNEGNQLAVEHKQSLVPAWSACFFDQRHQVRQTLQQAYQEHHEKEDTELQTASVTESLQLRSLTIPLSQSAQAPSERLQKNRPTSHNVPCVLQASLALALIIFLGLGSLLAYLHYLAPNASPSITPSVQLTPTAIESNKLSWHILPSLPDPEADNSAIYVQFQGRPYIYLLGGYRGQKHIPDYDHNLYRYDILSAHWETVNTTSLPGTLNNAMATDDQGHLFFTAGYSTDTYTVSPAIYIYQLATNSLHKIIPPLQRPLGFGGSMLADQQGHLYITQGFMNAGQPAAQAEIGWYRYDIVSQQWHQLAPLPRGLGYTLLARDGNGSIFMFGGSSDAGQQQQSSQIYRYNIARDSWEIVRTTLPNPLSGAVSCDINTGKMIIIGSYGNRTLNGPGQAWLVNLYDMSWQALSAPPFGHSEMGSATCDNNGHAFVERGADATHHPTLDFWELSLTG